MASDTLPEEWRPVEGWPYEISSLGRVRRSISDTQFYNKVTLPGRIVKQSVRQAGHLYVKVHDAPRRGGIFVHRLVALAFVGPAPSPRHEVAHWDGDPSNNRPENLRWATRAENARDTIRHGRSTRGSKSGTAKITEGEVVSIRKQYATGMVSQSELSRRYGLSQPHVCSILNRKSWSWLPDDYIPATTNETAETA